MRRRYARHEQHLHGLHLAGVIGATADNGIGVAGINHVSRLLPVRVLGKCGGDFSDIIKAILWSAGLPVSSVPTNPAPAQVINLSFTAAFTCTPAMQDAIDRATAAGAIVVAAAGNSDGPMSPVYCRPAATMSLPLPRQIGGRCGGVRQHR